MTQFLIVTGRCLNARVARALFHRAHVGARVEQITDECSAAITAGTLSAA
jgi:hypothetical protein